jgi:hypothetical protein
MITDGGCGCGPPHAWLWKDPSPSAGKLGRKALPEPRLWPVGPQKAAVVCLSSRGAHTPGPTSSSAGGPLGHPTLYYVRASGCSCSLAPLPLSLSHSRTVRRVLWLRSAGC